MDLLTLLRNPAEQIPCEELDRYAGHVLAQLPTEVEVTIRTGDPAVRQTLLFTREMLGYRPIFRGLPAVIDGLAVKGILIDPPSVFVDLVDDADADQLTPICEAVDTATQTREWAGYLTTAEHYTAAMQALRHAEWAQKLPALRNRIERPLRDALLDLAATFRGSPSNKPPSPGPCDTSGPAARPSCSTPSPEPP